MSSAATCTGSLDGCHSTILRSDDVPGVHRGTGSSSSTRLSTEMSHVCGCYGTSSIYISHDHLHVAGTFGARPHSSSHRRHTHDTYTQVFETERSFLTPRRARTQRVTADARTRPRLGTQRKIRIYPCGPVAFFYTGNWGFPTRQHTQRVKASARRHAVRKTYPIP